MRDDATESKNTLSFSERLALLKILERHCRKIDDTEFCQYDGDMTDQRIAELGAAELGKPVTNFNVQGMRLEIFGKLRESRNWVQDPAGFAARLAAAEERVENLGRVVSGQNAKLERLRRLIEIASDRRFERMMAARAALVDTLKHGPTLREALDRAMRGKGFDVAEVESALFLVGAVLRKTATGEFVSLPAELVDRFNQVGAGG